MKRVPLCLACLLVVGALLPGQNSQEGRHIYQRDAMSVFVLYVQAPNGEFVAQGSGFLVADSKIATNAHVADAGKVFVQLGPARVPATQIALDEANDLAILRVEARLNVPPLTLATNAPAPGDPVFVISNPEGLTRTISEGIVSSTRALDGRQFVQITAPISHGSSGGPVLNVRGEVVAVADAYLQGGQNLNFAVPVGALRLLLAGQNPPPGTLDATLARAKRLERARDGLTYSTDPNSPYLLHQRLVASALNQALHEAGDRPGALLKVSAAALHQDDEVAAAAARKAVSLRASAEGNLALAYALDSEAGFLAPSNSPLLKQAESAAKASVSEAPTALASAELGDIEGERAEYSAAIASYTKALRLDRPSPSVDLESRAYRALAADCYASGQPVQGLAWFNDLVASGQATALDWSDQAGRLKQIGDFHGAGDAYRTSAIAGFGNRLEVMTLMAWCNAEQNYMLAALPDDALAAARKCVELGTAQSANREVADARSDMAQVFNQRGLYAEALDEAQQASSLEPTNAWYFDDMANALIGLQRYTEAVSAAKSALRLSDGKYGGMHFTLGSAYFQLKNWKLAERSFEQAARMIPKDPAPAYNVALCFVDLGDFPDAVTWYREYLLRDPNAKDRDQVLARIAILSTPASASPTEVPADSCSPAIESQIDGDFNGWDGETIFKLTNGEIWEQAEYDYEYEYAYMPSVTIYATSEGCKMTVDGMDDTILVHRIK